VSILLGLPLGVLAAAIIILIPEWIDQRFNSDNTINGG
jgi:capsular polysaccharide biosynthesis protein